MKLIQCIAFAILLSGCEKSLSSALSTEMARAKLQQALSSPSKKLTISPEIIIPEPTDPTALLLQSTQITKMSQSLRMKAKANAVFIYGSLTSLKVFCKEQESAMGNFPGPLPVIYCDSSANKDAKMDIEAISETGVDAVVYTINNGKEVASVQDISDDDNLKITFDSAQEHGLQIIPELILDASKEWSEQETSSLIGAIEEKCGSIPACLLSFPVSPVEDDETAKEEMEPSVLPRVSSSISKRLPILGSIREVAGGGRIGDAVAAYKEAGFNGAVLRCECLPGFRMNPDLNFVQGFWSAAISDLKSLKSKNFNFRSKVALDKDIPLEWYNYQKNVMESGALGKLGGGEGDPLNTDNGDYKGF